ncbi:hypothetical protein [Agrobacterium tumefaciens]|uniref:hypothetical protein n=1 Tax=Agrobacterium tumefaciens TaxID=358 RepID=UPI0021D03800|nr:hypothetical protein [Agrobacterium tumefaciens]UXS01616.1 hypothetical protein FY156_09110 [Agrobacterium tumefaciens]
MANLLPFLVITEIEAARLREATQGQIYTLDPRKVDLGKYAGKYVLPERVKYDENYRDNRDAFAIMETVALDADAIFAPPSPEELARLAALEKDE